MATQEPDRSTRRRWFRMPTSQPSRTEPSPEEPAIEEPAEIEPLQDDHAQTESEIPVPLDVPAAPAPAEVPSSAVEDDVGVAAPEVPEVPDEPVVPATAAEVAVEAPDAPAAAPGKSGAAGESDADPGPTDAQIAASMTLPRVISIANQKGGVGKTTTAVNLGAALAEIGYRVLVVDLDPQGNATTGLGISHRNVEGSIYDVIMNDTPVDDCVEPTSVKNLFVCPATIDLAGAEIELVPAFSRELKLKRALQSAREDYDFTLIDCPPSLGLLTVNGLAASDDVIVPIQCEYYALEGLGQLLRNVALVKSNLNPELDVRGIVLTMYDARTRLAVQVEAEVREHFGPKVYRTVVPRTVRISEAPSFGEPIIVFDPSSRGAIAYRELAKEVSRGTSRRVG
jgi:chromosome partitioning protein